MQRYLISLLFVFYGTYTFAQTEDKHMKFMGIPIDGPVSDFVSELEKKGFTITNISEEYWMKGNFATYDNCKIGISYVKSDNKVYSVAVLFPEYDNWKSIYSIYELMKNNLIEKYGKPASCTEEFQDISSSTLNDRIRMELLTMDMTDFNTFFESGIGVIQLSIRRKDNKNGWVLINYFDKKNFDIENNKIKDDL